MSGEWGKLWDDVGGTTVTGMFGSGIHSPTTHTAIVGVRVAATHVARKNGPAGGTGIRGGGAVVPRFARHDERLLSDKHGVRRGGPRGATVYVPSGTGV